MRGYFCIVAVGLKSFYTYRWKNFDIFVTFYTYRWEKLLTFKVHRGIIAVKGAKMIKRPLYLKQVEPFIDQDFIKILVGVRRAGKSTILGQVVDIIKSRGVPDKEICHIDFDSLDFAEVRTKHDFLELVKKHNKAGVKYYFFDEVQLVEKWDEVVSALYAEKTADIYISGSNSKLLSSELSTFLTGRYVNQRVFTLNFEEFIDFRKVLGDTKSSTREYFEEYRRRGGFPVVAASNNTYEQGDQIVSDVYASIVLRDIVQRKGVRNTELLSRVVKFVFDNIGNIFSANSVTDYLKNEHRTIAPETIYNYLDYLAEAFVINRVPRYDLRGKEVLKTQEKYYLGDISLLYAVNGRENFDSYLSGALENIVYHELVSHGYKVYIGKNGDREIDFVAENKSRRMFIQVATHLDSAKVIECEYGAFENLDEDGERYVLSLDSDVSLVRNNAMPKYLPEFILNEL